MYRFILLVVVLVVFLLGLIFHLQNDHLVEFNYFTGSIEYHFSVFMVLSFSAGAVLGVCTMLSIIARMQNRIRKLNKQVKLQNMEVSNLRSVPFREAK